MKLYEFFSVPSLDKHSSDNKKSEDKQEKLLNDVYWFILDHDKLHKEHFFPIAQKIQKQYKLSNKVNREKFVDCWMPMVKEGCMDYYKKNKMSGKPSNIFSETLVKTICKRLADQHIEDIINDEYQLGD